LRVKDEGRMKFCGGGSNLTSSLVFKQLSFSFLCKNVKEQKLAFLSLKDAYCNGTE
jgi:hypothetical protein